MAALDAETHLASGRRQGDAGMSVAHVGAGEAPDRAIWAVRLGVALAVIAVFRLFALALNGTELFVDEAQYWSWAQAPAAGYYSKPPLIAWIIAATTAVCGDGEFCVRLPATVLHLGTAGAIFLAARQLYSAEVGFWSALVYATLPAVSLSSGIISTDVPLLFAWSLALLAFAHLLTAPSYLAAVSLGVAIGIGLNAKYAMAYFVPCIAIYFLIAPEHRGLLRRPHLWIALALAVALILPNLAWNSANSFATFAHTADNANWKGLVLHPLKSAEFILGQLGVFGPILFGALVAFLWRTHGRLKALSSADKLLIALSVPIIVVVALQGLMSRAHANWAAAAYVTATILVTAVMIRDGAWRWLRSSLALHGVVAVVLAVATWQAGRFSLPIIGDPFVRTLGNRETASLVARLAAETQPDGRTVRAVLAADRDVAAALLYYGRSLDKPVFAWRDAQPRNHFELSRPFTARSPTPVLLVGPSPPSSGITRHFRQVVTLNALSVPAGAFGARTLHFAILDEFIER